MEYSSVRVNVQIRLLAIIAFQKTNLLGHGIPADVGFGG